MPNDLRPHSAEDRELRKRLDEISQRRVQREREWDALLAERDRQIHQTSVAAELEAKIKGLQEQMADTLAELDEQEPPAAPEPSGQKSLGPEGIFQSPEEAAVAAGPWSPEFAAWRRQHIPSSRGLI
jgi:hypothetical protein